MVSMFSIIKRLVNKIEAFIKSRLGLSMLIALQIFILKTTRTKTLVIAGVTVLISGHIIGMHVGICPLKDIAIYHHHLLNGK